MGIASGGHRGRSLALAVAAAGLIAATQPPSADAAFAHTVVEGETLSGIAAINGISTESLAAFNGISAETLVITGTIVQIPSAAELGTTATTTTATTTTTTTTAPSVAPATVPASWTAPIYSPLGAVYLASNAASAWSAMRDAALSQFGIDIYPAGPLSGYRTWEQQSYLYNLYLAGVGAPANPPGTSSHEYGTAVDLASPEMRTVIDQIGPAYGWSKIHGPDEWWHVDYVGG
jgi:LAS superfamily LD-carboxypeptidase LdcB